VYKFQPSEIWEMTMEEIAFWKKGTSKILKWKENTNGI